MTVRSFKFAPLLNEAEEQFIYFFYLKMTFWSFLGKKASK